jgi:hypothetical protein
MASVDPLLLQDGDTHKPGYPLVQPRVAGHAFGLLAGSPFDPNPAAPSAEITRTATLCRSFGH